MRELESAMLTTEVIKEREKQLGRRNKRCERMLRSTDCRSVLPRSVDLTPCAPPQQGANGQGARAEPAAGAD